jgi:hypothetical protein
VDVVPEHAQRRRRVGGAGGDEATDETPSAGGVGAHDAADALPTAAEEEGSETLEQWGSAVVLMLAKRRVGEGGAGGLLEVPLNNWDYYMRQLGGREGMTPKKNVKKKLGKLGFATYFQQGAWFVKTDDRGGQALQEYMRRSSS